MTFEYILLIVAVAALCGNLLVSYQMRDRLEGILKEMQQKK